MCTTIDNNITTIDNDISYVIAASTLEGIKLSFRPHLSKDI